MRTTFKTSDGYTLHFVDGVWVDSLNPDLVDMTFASAKVLCVIVDGRRTLHPVPVDRLGEMLDGRLVEVTS